jgi:cellulose synthase (UDP-forming)
MVMTTALAAKAIRYPHETWVLDDGRRPEMREAAEAPASATSPAAPTGRTGRGTPKAGNLNNALFQTAGEFMMILDADQIPDPAILDKTLGWFTRRRRRARADAAVLHRTCPDADPLGSQAPLFYGPIQQGKDGWNAAFFCGSNAVLRREALMQIGVVGYVREVERAGPRGAQGGRPGPAQRPAHGAAAGTRRPRARRRPARAVSDARRLLADGEPVSEVTYRFQRASTPRRGRSSRRTCPRCTPTWPSCRTSSRRTPSSACRSSTSRRWRPWLARVSPLQALETVQALVRAVDVDRSDEAQPVMPMATISVTEDMATAMRLHSDGWKTVYHHEVLAHGSHPRTSRRCCTSACAGRRARCRCCSRRTRSRSGA